MTMTILIPMQSMALQYNIIKIIGVVIIHTTDLNLSE